MTAPRLAPQPWMSAPGTRAVLGALHGEARFVGGCVRNALLGAAVEDIDLATPLLPQDVIRRLTDAGLRAVPTGIDHGTVTGIAHGRPFEITTLRRDVATDGRRAVVAFTDDWAQDAARRDFTINALYADETGLVFDYTGGLADIASRKVRFIGDAGMRIREDYLRILRFFRFHAWYGAGALDADGLAACRALKEGLASLSAERVQKELLRLLGARDPVPALQAMDETGVLKAVLPQAQALTPVARLGALGAPARAGLLRLAALLGAGDARGVAARLRLSNSDAQRLETLLARHPALTEERIVRAQLYAHGADAVAGWAMLDFAREALSREACAAVLGAARGFSRPHFPLSGADVLAAGVPQGPALGEILNRLEAEWVAGGFAATREALLERLRALTAR